MPQVYRDQRNGQRQFMTAEIRVVWLITQGSRFKSFSATKARSPFSNREGPLPCGQVKAAHSGSRRRCLLGVSVSR